MSSCSTMLSRKENWLWPLIIYDQLSSCPISPFCFCPLVLPFHRLFRMGESDYLDDNLWCALLRRASVFRRMPTRATLWPFQNKQGLRFATFQKQLQGSSSPLQDSWNTDVLRSCGSRLRQRQRQRVHRSERNIFTKGFVFAVPRLKVPLRPLEDLRASLSRFQTTSRLVLTEVFAF